MSTLNKDILSKDVLIYPSANAIDGGELNTEENLSALSDKFYFRTFVVERKGREPGLAITSSGTSVNISAGECFIEGRYNLVRDAIVLDMTTLKDEFDKTIFNYLNTTYYIFLQQQYDITGCVMGDKTNFICGGLTVVVSSSNTFDHAILLGTVTATGSGTIEVEDDSSKYCIVDVSQVGSEDGTLLDTIQKMIRESVAGDSDVITLTKSTKQNSPAVIFVSGTTTAMVNNPGNGIVLSFNTTNSLTVNPEGVIYNGTATAGQPLNLITKIDELESKIDGGGVEIATSGGETTTPDGATKNGTSTKVARSDHYHTGYIKNSVGQSDTNVTQNIGTNLSVAGEVRASRVYNAVWNDYADALPKAPNIQTEPGDIIAKDEYSEGYVLGTSYNPRLVVGVHSDSWGHLLGGIEGKLDDYIPVAVCGNVRVKVVGKVKIGDFIVASFVPGVGAASSGYVPGTIVGKALESKETDEVSRILMQVMLI